MNIVQSSFNSKIHNFLSPIRSKGNGTDYTSRLNPACILYLARLIQVQDQIIIINQILRDFSHHHNPPRSFKWSYIFNRIIHLATDHVTLPFTYYKLGPTVVNHFCLSQTCIKSISQLKSQWPFSLTRPVFNQHTFMFCLGKRSKPAVSIFRYGKSCKLFSNA